MTRGRPLVRTVLVVAGALLVVVAGWQLFDAGSTLRGAADRARAAADGGASDVRGTIEAEHRVLGVELEEVSLPVDGTTVRAVVLGGGDAGPGDDVTLAFSDRDATGVLGVERSGADTPARAADRRALAASVGGLLLMLAGLFGLFIRFGSTPSDAHEGVAALFPGGPR